MYDCYNYPPGADNEYAPWNIPDNDEMDFEVLCSQTLSRTVPITTTNYEVKKVIGFDDSTNQCVDEFEIDTSNTNWLEEYRESNYHTPQDLLLLFKNFLQDKLENASPIKDDERYLRHLIHECESWTEDDLEIREV